MSTNTSLQKKIEESENCLLKCRTDPLVRIEGIQKLSKKLEAELNFLKRLRENKNKIVDAQVDSSNLVHLAALVHAATFMPGVVSILKPFRYQNTLPSDSAKPSFGNSEKFIVDVVIDNGHTWVKVVARNPASMDFLSTGQGHFGEKSILEHAQVYLTCAQQNLIYFTIPTVQFLFYNGINEVLNKQLTSQGVIVKNLEITQTSVGDHTSCDILQSQILSNKIRKLNLDVSTMMAYVSSLTNGGTNFKFQEKILTEHAEMEQKNPIKIYLDELFKDRELVACETAIKDFNGILDKVGGDGEKQRAREFLQRVKTIPDSGFGSCKDLKLVGKIRERSMLVFGAGEAVQAVTVTANGGFVRAAHSQQINLPAVVHESRMLTEQKEKTAVRLIPNNNIDE